MLETKLFSYHKLVVGLYVVTLRCRLRMTLSQMQQRDTMQEQMEIRQNVC